MAFYGDVTPGDDFVPSASLSNDVRHLINSLNGFGGRPFGWNGSGTVRVQVYNASDDTIRAGTAVNFDEGMPRVDEALPVKALTDPKRPWGVVTQDMERNDMGDCFISGPVTVCVSGSGDYAQPSAGSPKTFTRGTEGAPVLFAFGSQAVINLGAGTPENYDGPFAMKYDAESGMIKVKPGYLSRNGQFVSVGEASLEPQDGLICVESKLGNGEWSEPEIKFGTPSKECYPVGKCKVSGSGDTRSVSLCQFRVPVAILIVTAECPLSAEADDDGGN